MSNGIRIIAGEVDQNISLQDILREISNGENLNWSILFMDASIHLDNGYAKHVFDDDVNKSEKGLIISWKNLGLLAEKIFNDLEMLIIGCKDMQHLHRYENDQAMYEACDVVIEMIDTGFWEIFSNESQIINRLEKKYGTYELLEPDFQKRYQK